jgi:hypothetical protein
LDDAEEWWSRHERRSLSGSMADSRISQSGFGGSSRTVANGPATKPASTTTDSFDRTAVFEHPDDAEQA